MQTHPLSFKVPLLLMSKIRAFVTKRKNTNHPNRTQKAIILELLENGLLVTDGFPSAEPNTPIIPQELNNTLPLF